jgi:RNA-directed DNA polymerase
MNSTKETQTGQHGLEQIVQTSLMRISTKAKKLEKYRFRNLYTLLNRIFLLVAWKRINKKAAAGADKVTAKVFKKNLEANINKIVSNLKRKRYRAKLVRRVYIDKGIGKKRPLGIPVLVDKIVQRAVAMILEAIYEQDFIEDSYGYRPKRSAKMAINKVRGKLQFNKFKYVVEADIKGYFDNIKHDWMVRMLEERVDDRQFIGLIRKWLKAGILEEDGKIKNPVTGTPQGGIISPILANIYLHYALDIWFENYIKVISRGKAYYCRYADDFICAFEKKEDAERFYHLLADRLNKFGLELALDKTNIISFSRYNCKNGNSFEFLGFEFKWEISRKGKPKVAKRTSRKKLRKSIKNFTIWCKEYRNKRLGKIFKKLNSKLRGYYNYYGLIDNYKSLEEFFEIAKKILYKWLNRRSQRKSFNWEEFKDVLKKYRIERPRITEKRNNQMKLKFN